MPVSINTRIANITWVNAALTLPDAVNAALTFDGTNLGIGTSSPSVKLDVNGTIKGTTLLEGATPVVVQTDIGTAPNEIPLNQYLGSLAFRDQLLVSVPASATAAGNVGDVAANASYIYVCIAPNSWVRSSATTW